MPLKGLIKAFKRPLKRFSANARKSGSDLTLFLCVLTEGASSKRRFKGDVKAFLKAKGICEGLWEAFERPLKGLRPFRALRAL